eukprot:4020358-Pyramimonas_sp.AAC.1
MFCGPRGSSSECGAYSDSAHNCIWLGPAPNYFPTILWRWVLVLKRRSPRPSSPPPPPPPSSL